MSIVICSILVECAWFFIPFHFAYALKFTQVPLADKKKESKKKMQEKGKRTADSKIFIGKGTNSTSRLRNKLHVNRFKKIGNATIFCGKFFDWLSFDEVLVVKKGFRRIF